MFGGNFAHSRFLVDRRFEKKSKMSTVQPIFQVETIG